MNKVVLAYSGGLDTSIILKWLQDDRACDVCTFTADVGQGEDHSAVREKARSLGASEVFIDDLREEFVRDFVFPMFRANALYEGEYLLGSSIARPLIAKRLVEIADQVGASAIAHGATGKGNDQVRFELGACALRPDIEIIAPWREWKLNSRTALMSYAERRGIEIEKAADGAVPYSMDANLLHVSYEGGDLEDPWAPANESMWTRTISPACAPDEPAYVDIDFLSGDPVTVDAEPLSPAALLETLNELAGRHGVGRVDIVENRYVGIKSRGCYETPGGTLLAKAHRAMESLTIDREAQHLKDEMMPRYATLVYNGYWWSDERMMLQQMIDASQRYVTGTVRLKLYKGSVSVVGRKSPVPLFDRKTASFEADEGAYDQSDASGFIKLNALRLKLVARRNIKVKSLDE